MSLLLAVSCCLLWAQMFQPVHFASSFDVNAAQTEADLHFTATIDPGWHVYSTDIPDGGPTAATIHIDHAEGVELTGDLTPQGAVRDKFDEVFQMQVRYFERQAAFVQHVRFTSPHYLIEGYLEYGACNDETCLPPTQVPFSYKGVSKAIGAPAAGKATVAADATQQANAVAASTQDAAQPVDAGVAAKWWTPVTDELKAFGGDSTIADRSWLYIFLAGLVGGLLALLTPCVWPIIPMTVSFFLKRSKSRSRGIRDALTYGLSIIIIYVGIGLLLTAWRGPAALNALATNAVFNVFLFLLLVVFAASFFGAFDITLPSSWTNRVNAKADATTGVLSIFLMAFTLALVSFSCTGPIIGFILVEVAVSGSYLAPALGMLGFAIALALPFTLFALFPAWLKTLPRSGGWMNVVKVSLAFIELAFALKFLSVADLAYGWHLLDRETFLSLWIVIFSLLGVYLLGGIRFPHDDEHSRVGVPRLFLAMASLAFAVYMLPGLWGAPLRAVSAFAPPMTTQDFVLQNVAGREVRADFNDYDEGMAYALRAGKPVLLDFTGYGCVNCRKMEGSVWKDAKVAELITRNFVVISLIVDSREPLPQPMTVSRDGRPRVLKTVGEKWSYLQQTKFGANTQPFYVLLDNDGRPLNKSYSYNEDIGSYLDFLQTGLDNYRHK